MPFEVPVQIPVQLLLKLEANILDKNVNKLEFELSKMYVKQPNGRELLIMQKGVNISCN